MKFRVAICRSAFNWIDVEAEDESTAHDKAADIFDSMANPVPDGIGQEYDTMVIERLKDD